MKEAESEEEIREAFTDGNDFTRWMIMRWYGTLMLKEMGRSLMMVT